MKHSILIILSILGLLSKSSFASSKNLFELDNGLVAAQLSQATEIEKYVISNNNATLSNMLMQSEYANSLNLKNLTSNFKQFTFDSMDWTAFLWGFCCFPIGAGIGVFVVLLDDSASKDSKISYLIGAGAGFIFSTTFWRVSYYNGWIGF